MARQFLALKGFLSFLILHELRKKQLCGEDLAKKLGKRKGGDPLTPGTIYPALKDLREHKLVSYDQSGRKKTYSLTKAGEKELEKHYHEFSRYFYGLKRYITRPKKTTKISKQKRKVAKKKKV
ncbi:PadR family transcriptional regulator [Candidatus Woesearchaeota archaeon]|nr:PadR family transcriptional regulator [Candidatus Woesearchaeota archaeon]